MAASLRTGHTECTHRTGGLEVGRGRGGEDGLGQNGPKPGTGCPGFGPLSCGQAVSSR